MRFWNRGHAKQYKSGIHGDIRVTSWFGKKALVAGGVRQSGAEYEWMWSEVMRRYAGADFRQGLVLGVGGGTVIQYMLDNFPKMQIVGVELDPVMLAIAEEQFGIVSNERLDLVQEDAYTWLRRYKNLTFDFIVVDLFVGRKNPEWVGTRRFLFDLKRLVSLGGVVVINRQFQADQHDEWERFWVDCCHVFSVVRILFGYPANRVVGLYP